MTRRKFLKYILKIGSAAALMGVGSVKWLADKVAAGFVRARRMNKYPGKLVTFNNIDRQGKWSG